MKRINLIEIDIYTQQLKSAKNRMIWKEVNIFMTMTLQEPVVMLECT